ncbi:membrane hypothetical protein [Syntrophobacter sp. SbD1]|nr:membrane hypothetical protein [Syntrophobacter sp. SbD1]
MLTLFRKLFLFVITSSLFLMAVPVSAHNLPMGCSFWAFGKNDIVIAMDFKTDLFPEIKGIKEGHYNLDSISDEQLQQIGTDVIQPYINEKLVITVGGKAYPVRVNKITKNINNYTIWLSVDHVSFNNTGSPVKIVYSLLFEETHDEHINLASGYLSDARGDALQKVFDYSSPAMQMSFENKTRVWQFSVKGSADAHEGNIWTTIREFIPLGIEHILTGYDHIAFLLALIVIWLPFKEILKIITAFTVAHSITLLLAATQIVSLDARFVECVIALSICYVAVENLFKKKVHYRWLITFGFGLVHGFGFASALQELIVGKSNLLVSVVSFNAGVEIGQLMIVCVMLPVLHLLKKVFEFRTITAGASVPIFLLGFTWFIERVFDLKLLWF